MEKNMAKEAKVKGNLLRFDLGLFLLATGAMSNITIWIGAFMSSEAESPINHFVSIWLLPILGGISGLAMALTVAIGIVFVIAKLNAMKPTIDRKVAGKKKGTKITKTLPNARYYMGWGSIMLLLGISAAMLPPQVYMMMSGKPTLYAVLGDRWASLWSVARVLAADLALGAIAMVQGVHLPTSAGVTAQPAPATSATRSGSQPVRTAKTATKGAKDSPKNLRPCNVPGCGISYVWPQGKGAHYKQYHKDLIIQKGIPVQMSATKNEAKKEGNK
jgi:hypothetical protein